MTQVIKGFSDVSDLELMLTEGGYMKYGESENIANGLREIARRDSPEERQKARVTGAVVEATSNITIAIFLGAVNPVIGVSYGIGTAIKQCSDKVSGN